jgi:hypothetical protein
VVLLGLLFLLLPGARTSAGTGARTDEGAALATACPHFGRPAVAADPRAHAVRVLAVQFAQRPAQMRDGAAYRHAIACVMKREIAPHLARGRANVVVFDEDVGLETIATGPRGAGARALLRSGVPSCAGAPLCPTLHTLTALNAGYARALTYLQERFPKLSDQLGRSFVAATDTFVRVFMTTMAAQARAYGVYVIASNTQPRFRLSSDRAAVAALRDPATPHVRAVYAPTSALAYDHTFVWAPKVIHRRAPYPLRNLIADNFKVPLTAFEQELGFGAGPAGGRAARANLRPVRIPDTRARLGLATSLPAFEYGPPARGHECDDVIKTYMRCLDRLGANVLIQADANDGPWAGVDANGQWQPLSWMGSAYRAVSDPSVNFAYAVNPFMVGNLSDTPFDGQSAVLQRGRRGVGCAYVGNHSFLAGQDAPALRAYAGSKPQFLALAPWAVADASRANLRAAGDELAAGRGRYRYVETAVIADLPFPPDRHRPGCVRAGR